MSAALATYAQTMARRERLTLLAAIRAMYATRGRIAVELGLTREEVTAWCHDVMGESS